MTSFEPTPEQALHRSAETLSRMREQIRNVVIGQREVVDQVLVTLLAGGHALVEGVPGLGKTLLARALARSFAGEARRVQFTPDLMPADLVGHVLYDVKTGEMRLRHGPVFTQLLLADEINRAPAKTQAALLEVMQERQVTLEGDSLPVPAPFMTLATQNPIEMEGTYPLPEAQLDRFLLNIRIEYPGEAEELELLSFVTQGRVGDSLPVEGVEPVASADDVLDAQRAATTLRVDERIRDYALRIVRATRERPDVALGAGPRGAIALIRAARASALLAGRDFVIPDDVKALARPALRHRIRLAPEADLEGRSPDLVLSDVLAAVEAPRA